MSNVESQRTATDSTSRSARLRSRWTLIALAVAAALVAYYVTYGRTSSPKTLTQAEVTSTAQSIVDKALAKAASTPARSVAVYKAIVPSLVVIRTNGAGDAAPDTPDTPNTPDTPDTAATPNTKSFSTPTVPGTEKKFGLGTGVVINDKGAILTANHVVAGAISIRLTFADGTTTSATILSQEPKQDIAVLMPDKAPSVIVPAVMGGGVQVGDETYAVGHPLGLTSSLSAGVISGLNRSIRIANGSTLEGLIQFDAAVNPGNSGGPLLNRNGQVVGIVTGLANPSEQGFFVGIGFAVPIGTAGGAAGGPPQ